MDEKTPHYYVVADNLTVIDIIVAFGKKCDANTVAPSYQLFLIGNIFKYLFRFPFKRDPVGDLKKASHYLQMLIVLVGEQQEKEAY